MLAVKITVVRDNFKSFCDQVFNGETLIVSRPKNEKIVMLSEQKYNEYNLHPYRLATIYRMAIRR